MYLLAHLRVLILELWDVVGVEAQPAQGIHVIPKMEAVNGEFHVRKDFIGQILELSISGICCATLDDLCQVAHIVLTENLPSFSGT